MKPLIDKFYKAKEKPVDNTHRKTNPESVG